MIGDVAIITDSASYLPKTVIAKYGVEVVPMHVALDGCDYREFVDLDAATFYERLDAGAAVRTSQPSPGEFADAYERAAAGGATAILSIHIGSALSGTANSTRIAAAGSPIPVRIVDTGQGSFVEGLAVWAACDALSEGASFDAAEAAALATAGRTGNVFIVRGTQLLERSGRYAGSGQQPDSTKVPILAFVDGAVRPIGEADSRERAMTALVDYLVANAIPGARLRIGISNGGAAELANELEQRVRTCSLGPLIDVLVQYEVGPAVGAHTGSGCTGIVFESRPCA